MKKQPIEEKQKPTEDIDEKTAEKKAERKSDSGCFIVFLIVIVLSCGLFGLSSIIERPSTSRSNRTSRPAATRSPFVTFTTVRNDCGICGTNSPVGGWEAEDGRTLVLSESGTFTAFDGEGTLRGEWKQSGRELCLMPSLGGEVCFEYQQKVDAMKLDEAIYIRR